MRKVSTQFRVRVSKFAAVTFLATFLFSPATSPISGAFALTANSTLPLSTQNLTANAPSLGHLPTFNVVDTSTYFHVPDGHLDITFDDLSYILDQIKFGEAHSNRTSTPVASLQPDSATATIVYPYDLTSIKRCLLPEDLVTAADGTYGLTGLSNAYTYNNLQPWGVRQVDGQCNNITNVQPQTIPTDVYQTSDLVNGTSTDHWGAADLPFIRMTPATNDPTHPLTSINPSTGTPNYPGTNIPLSPTQVAYETPTASVSDPTPRIISDLISDQSTNNPAALAAAKYSSSNLYGASPLLENSVNATNGVVTPVYEIPNVTPDYNVSAGYNSWFTLFGQFFDHGLDLVPKAGATVFIPLQTNDLLYSPSPYSPNFMVLTRAADATGNSINITTPYVDQSQTYGSHASQNFFLREYTFDSASASKPGAPHTTGYLLDGNDLSTDGLTTAIADVKANGGTLNFPSNASTSSDNKGLPTWKVMKAQALLLGIRLTDYDVVNVPVVATDQYGKFIPDPSTGFPMMLMHGSNGQYMWRSGTSTSPVATGATTAGIEFSEYPGVLWHAVGSGHPFLNDTMNAAVPFGQNGQPLLPDADSIMNSNKANTPGYYDNENLDSHYIAGDARVNENIGLSAIHGVFHSEHNTVAKDIFDFINSNDPRITNAVYNEWTPERIYQAARLVMEMEYQHMAYDEFIRRIAPNLPPFVTYNPNYNASITAEFASAVYRLGHSMLNETIARSNPGQMYDPANNQDVSLISAFTNPSQVRLVRPAVISSASWSGSSITFTLKDGEVAPASGSIVTVQNMVDASFDVQSAVVDTTTSNTFTVSTAYAGGASISATPLALKTASTLAMTAADPNHTGVNYSIADVSISDPGTNGFSYSPMESAAAIAQGMSAQRGNEVDEFVTDSVRNNLLGLPLDLASLNITRGRDTGLPTLNQFRAKYAANLPIYTSWNDYIYHLRYKESGTNFVAAYGTHPSLTAPVTIGNIETATATIDGNNKYSITYNVDTVTVHVGDVVNIEGYAVDSPFNFSASAKKYAVVSAIGDHSFTVASHLTHGPSEIVSYASAGQLMAGSMPIAETGTASTETTTATVTREKTIVERRAAADALLTSTSQDAKDFLSHTGTWANKETGIDYIDLWDGGLAENPAKQPNLPGLLGPTFQFIFQEQTLKLQDGDRFYYLGRIVGVDLGDTIPAQKFTDIVRRNTPSRSVDNPNGRGIIGMQSPGFSVSDCAFSDNRALTNDNTRCADSTMTTTSLGIIHAGLDNVTAFADPASAAGVRLVGGAGDDSLIGGPGNDYLDGGESGGDLLSGGAGDDILIGGAGDDLLEGGPGNDVIDAGDAQVGDISDGGSGNDWLTCDNCNLIIPSQLGESGDDFIQAGKAIDTLTMGGEGNDWIEGMGGDDVQLSGDDNVGGGTNFQVQITGGNDVIIGGAGFDTSFGDGGDDIFPAGDAWDQIDGNEGFDWVTYEGTSRFDNGQTVLPSAFADLTLAQAPVTATQTDVLINVEGLSGSSGNDLLVSGLGQDIVEPGVTGRIGGRTLYINGTLTTIVDGMAVSGAGIAPNTFVMGKPTTVISGAVNGVGGITQTVVQLTGSITGDITNGNVTFSMQPIDDVNFMTNLPALTNHTPGASIHFAHNANLVIATAGVRPGRGGGGRTTYTINNFNYSGDTRITVGGVVRLTPLTATTPVYTGNVASVNNGAKTFTVTGWDVVPPSSGTYFVDYGFATTKWAGGYIVTGGDGNDEIQLLAGSNIVHGSYSLHVCLQVKGGAYNELADVNCGTDSSGNVTRGYSSMTPLNTPMVNGVLHVNDVKVVRELVATDARATSVTSSADASTATYTLSKQFIAGDKISIVTAPTPTTWDLNNASIVSASKSAPYTVTVQLPVTRVSGLTTNKQAIVTAVSHQSGTSVVTYTANNTFRANDIVSVTGFNTANAAFNSATGAPFTVTSASSTEFTIANSAAPSTDAVITSASITGTTVTYVADNAFTPGLQVTITGLKTATNANSGFNLTRQTIISATPTQFTITVAGNFCAAGGRNPRNCAAATGGNATVSIRAGAATAQLVTAQADTQLVIPRGNDIAVGYQVTVDPANPIDGIVNLFPSGVFISNIVSLGNMGSLVTLNKAINVTNATLRFNLPPSTTVAMNATAKNTDTVTEPYSSSYYTITAAAAADIAANHATSGYIITDVINGGIDTVYDVEMIKYGCTDVITCATRTAVPITVQSSRQSTPPTLTPNDDAALIVATVGIDYRQSFILSGTPLPSLVTLATGTLPPGLTLSALGVISGVPTTAGSYAFSVTTTTTSGTFTSPVYTITVSNLSLPVIAYSGYVTSVQQNQVFPGATVVSTGGQVGAYTISPNLPAGMSIDPVTGKISGRPSVVTGNTVYTVTATNLTGSATADFIFEVKAIGAAAGVAILPGMKHVADVLTANTASTTGTGPFTFTYQWQTGFITPGSNPAVYNWTDIVGETGTTHTLSTTDFQQYIRVLITATNSVGSTSATSNAVGPIYGPGLPPTADVAIVGAPFVGRTFTADTRLSINTDAQTTYQYQWSRSLTFDGVYVPVPGATATSYVSDNTFSGYLKIVVTETNAAGSSTAFDIVGPLATLAPTAAVTTTSAALCTPNPDACSYVGVPITANASLTQGSAVTFTYVWAATAANAAKTAAYTAIRAQTAPTYTPVAGDVNKYIRAQATATNSQGISTVYSQVIKIVQGQQSQTPVPTISGTPIVGNVLTANPGIWDAGTVLTYQWLRNGTAISRATATTYTVVAADAGASLSIRVTGTKVGFATFVATSATVSVNGSSFTTTTLPTITGSAVLGSRLTASISAWTPAATFTYAWTRTCSVNNSPVLTAIAGATTNSYTLTSTDVGCSVFVTVRGARSGYTTIAAQSDPTAVVTAGYLSSTPTPSINGTVLVGSLLTAAAGTWDTGVTLTYAWYRGLGTLGTRLGTATTYRPVAADNNQILTLAVTGSKVGFYPVTTTVSTNAVGAGLIVNRPSVTIGLVGGSTATTGAVLTTASSGTWDNGVIVSTQWFADGNSIPGPAGTAASYTVQPGDVGKTITATVTGTKSGYVPVTIISSNSIIIQ